MSAFILQKEQDVNVTFTFKKKVGQRILQTTDLKPETRIIKHSVKVTTPATSELWVNSSKINYKIKHNKKGTKIEAKFSREANNASIPQNQKWKSSEVPHSPSNIPSKQKAV